MPPSSSLRACGRTARRRAGFRRRARSVRRSSSRRERSACSSRSAMSDAAVSTRRQGPERERRCCSGFPPPHSGRSLEQLRARGGDEEDRTPRRPLDELVDEVEQTVVGPVHVLEDEDRPVPARPRLEQRRQAAKLSCARRGLESPRRRVRRADVAAARPSQRPPPARALRPSRASFVAAASWPVTLEDPRLRFYHLAECPEADASAVGETATLPPDDELGIRIHDARQLVDHPRSSRSPGRRPA